MDTRQKNLMLGGAIVVGGLIGCYALYKMNKSKQGKLTGSQNSRESIIRILKEIRCERIKALTGAPETNKEVGDLLKKHSVQTRKQLTTIPITICKEHGTNLMELRDVFESLYRQDSEVSILFKDAIIVFEEAFIAHPPQLEAALPIAPTVPDVPEFITEELVLNIAKESMKSSLKQMNDVLIGLRNNGIPTHNPNDPRVAEAVQNIPDLMEGILSKAGFDKFQEPSIVLFDKALGKFKILDTNQDQFCRKMGNLSVQYEKAFNAVVEGSPSAAILIEGVGAHLSEDSEAPNAPLTRGFSKKFEDDTFLQELAKLSADAASNQ